MTASTKLDAALAYAAAGIKVFPCVAGTKRPATARGFHDASDDADVIRRWWSDDSDYNLAACPEQYGQAVVDLDGDAGDASWCALEHEHGEVETRTVLTPHGYHLYFKGELPPTQSLLGPHVDTRGRGSYALLPPSTLADGGVYSWADDREPVELPEWVGQHIAALQATREKARHDRMDDPANVERFATWLRDARPAVEGDNGDKRTFVTACQGLELGLTAATTLKMMSDLWNPRCLPPWDEEDLETKVSNAARYAQNEAGAWATTTGEEAFGSVLDTLGLRSPVAGASPRKRFQGLSYSELRQRPPPTWLIPGRLPDKRVTLLYGPPGSYKSFIALNDALTLASLGMPVLYVTGEGVLGTTQRIAAWELARGIPVDDLPFQMVEDMPYASDSGDCDLFVTSVIESGFKPALVIIDTVRRAMLELNENDARDMGRMVAVADRFKRYLDCAVLLIHHTRKDGSQAAGSGALWAGVDAAVEIQVAEEAPKSKPAVALWVRRMKDAREAEHAWCFEGHEVGDSLAFQTLDYAAFRRYGEHRHQNGPDELEVRQALERSNITSPTQGFTTRMLAVSLHIPLKDEPEELYKANIERLERQLTSEADRLSQFCEGGGRDRRWFAPPPPRVA